MKQSFKQIDGFYDDERENLVVEKVKDFKEKQIPEFKYKVHCKCGNILIGSDTQIPKWLIKNCIGTPCSACVPETDYKKMLENE